MKGNEEFHIINVTSVCLLLVYMSTVLFWGYSSASDEALAHYRRGFGHLQAGQYDEAIADFTIVIEMNPKLSMAYVRRGNACAFKGQHDKAISDYTEALSIDPKNSMAYRDRAMVYLAKGQYDKAWEDIHKLQDSGLSVDPIIVEALKESARKGPAKKYPIDTSFHESKFFGGNIGDITSLEMLPEGRGVLIGKFIHDGKPARDIKLKLFLNSKYVTAPLTTNYKGTFTLSLPIGKWYINMVQCESWKGKPEGSFILVGGNEPALNGDDFEELFFGSPRVKEVEITEEVPKTPHIVLNINRRIELVWPKAGRERQQATIAKSAIRWHPHPGAEDYVIQISRVRRESSTSKSYFPIFHKRLTKKNVLSLRSIPHGRDLMARLEYVAVVRAYGRQGEFLSSSEFFGGSFSIVDRNIVLKPGERIECGIDGAVLEEGPATPPDLTIIQGMITDHRGNPVEGVRIDFHHQTTANTVVKTGSEFSDEDGNYLIDSFYIRDKKLRGGVYELFIYPDPRTNLKSQTLRIDVQASQTKTLNIDLEQCGSISGQVVDSEGNPMTEAWVYETNKYLPPFYHVCIEEECGGPGQYIIGDLDRGDYSIGVNIQVAEQKYVTLPAKNVKVELGKTTILNFLFDK